MERYRIGIAYPNNGSRPIVQLILFGDRNDFDSWSQNLRKAGYKKFEVHPLPKFLSWISHSRRLPSGLLELVEELAENMNLKHSLRQIAEKTPPHNEHGEPAYRL